MRATRAKTSILQQGAVREKRKKKEREKKTVFFSFFSHLFFSVLCRACGAEEQQAWGDVDYFLCVHDVRPKERRGLTRQETNEKKKSKKIEKNHFFFLAVRFFHSCVAMCAACAPHQDTHVIKKEDKEERKSKNPLTVESEQCFFGG
jgi:hypothetical protein